MTEASQQLQVPQEEFALLTSSNSLGIFKVASAALFACALALAPAPAFAQHGGGGGGRGGGGGGGSHGGGGGGGAHGGFGGGGGASAPMSSGGGGSHATGGSSGGSTGGTHNGNSTTGGGSNSGGHSWNPFHSSAAKPAAPANGTNSMPAGNIKSEGSATNAPAHFAAGNNTWVEPPQDRGVHRGQSELLRSCEREWIAPVRAAFHHYARSRNHSARRGGRQRAASLSADYSGLSTYYPYYPYPYFGYNPFLRGIRVRFGRLRTV